MAATGDRMHSDGLVSRRAHSTDSKGKEAAHKHGDHDHDHGEEPHSHGIFGHTHSHDENGHSHGGQVIEALQNRGDPGSRITLIGLGSNVILTSAKGAAGYFMNSAALLADAGHSLSDLLGDFVVLFSWRLSRRPPSPRYPYGFAKFETLGTTVVAILLIGGALGIGAHSLSLLFDALASTAASLPPGALQTAISSVTSAAHSVPAIGTVVGHEHAHAHVLDPNAAWFAAASVVCKEWLFRITKKVAEQESSPVLFANAYHHRSDAYSSVVALAAIMGSSWFPALPLDPIGGLLVSLVILRQGMSIFGGAFGQLTDASASKTTLHALHHALDEHAAALPDLLAVHDLRARRTGAALFVDLTVDVPRTLSVAQTQKLELAIHAVLKEAKKEIAEVTVRFRPA
ncbi:cation efflux protein [Dentipellis sp. KUC8613]|nr:cation efflux protein [Dentipellis sp. KUC8613]